MNRRQLIGRAGAAVAGTMTRQTGWAMPKENQTADVVVAGAGTFGAWTAYHLSRLGAKVLLIDAYGPGNSRASSGGETRQIQADRDSEMYTRSAIDSYGIWQQLEADSGVPLVRNTGKLMISTLAGSESAPQAISERHQAFGIGGTELLKQDELRYRYPQIQSDDVEWALYSEGAAGSILMARRSIEALVGEFEKGGGRFQIAYGMPVLKSDGSVERIETQSGAVLSAQQYVFACGPWLAKLFPELLAQRLRVQRRDVLFFGQSAGDAQYSFPQMPAWSVVRSGFYGFPDIESRGFKVAPYPDYNAIDPDRDERLIMPHQVRRSRRFLSERFPGLADAPISETRVCQVTDTVDGHFIAAKHPSADNAWIVGGGSGHGFKHGPVVGRHVARALLGKKTDPAHEAAFGVMKETFA